MKLSLSRYAQALLVLTFGLLIVGGLVHNTRSSLACPDWPLCFGSAFPKMEGGVLVEHGHRLLATSVGLGTIGLLVGLILRSRRTGDTSLVKLGIGALLLVVAQGVLGGLTVIYRLPTIVSTAHLATSMLYFSLLIYINFRLRPTQVRPRSLGPALQRASLVGAIAIYLQMLVGALMRHLGAGLVCTDLPFCAQGVWPAGAHPNIQLHAFHRLFAIAVFFVLVWVATVAWRTTDHKGARAMATAAPLLALVQATLGWFSVSTFLDVLPVTLHLGVAALMLADLVSLHLVARGPSREAALDEAPLVAHDARFAGAST